MNPLTKDDLLDVLENTTLAQLRALRALRSPEARKRPAAAPDRKSNMQIIKEILLAANAPLHIDDIIQRAQRDHHRPLRRESLVSALTKKVLDRNTFCRPEPNTFDLLSRPTP
jgi:hypothetical protein